MPLDFKAAPLWVGIAVFAVSAGVVWVSGTRLSGHADTIAERTGIGHAFTGLVLLGVVTSLPEAAVTVVASAAGNLELAVNNLLGGIAFGFAILAVADAAIGRDALTSVVPDPVVMLQGSLSILLLALIAAGITVGDIALFGVGGWCWSVLVLYLLAVWMTHRSQGRFQWHPKGMDGLQSGHRTPKADNGKSTDTPLAGVAARTVAAGLAILIAGFFLSESGDAIATKTALGSSFVGVLLVAIATSLPEVSTVLAAVRLHRYEMAVSDIFGTNLFSVALVFLADAIHRGGPALNEVGRFAAVATLLGIVVTTLYIAGLVERRDRTIFRMGYDSLAVLATYLGGVFLLYRLR
ncbi:sodium:calcium antiporter [Methylocaldum sp.]|uniref:sodium:calcium antiporter n=1 Tax=Methylocaldum sp. TaxID=1969727 RepID=UPI002D2A0B72|nr:sodium:calcium antiporter [Methylocaldum sp.]HYE35796.1 sodium:calcium antiporter [Methylocaldum sp.]